MGETSQMADRQPSAGQQMGDLDKASVNVMTALLGFVLLPGNSLGQGSTPLLNHWIEPM